MQGGGRGHLGCQKAVKGPVAQKFERLISSIKKSTTKHISTNNVKVILLDLFHLTFISYNLWHPIDNGSGKPTLKHMN